MNTTNEENKGTFTELENWVASMSQLNIDRKKLQKFEKWACAYVDSTISKMSNEIQAKLSKDVEACWVDYLNDDDFNMTDWSEGNLESHIEDYIKDQIKLEAGKL